MDGGTQGLYLVQHIKEVQRLLVFDAVDFGQLPGTLAVVRDDDVPRFFGCRKLSLHQTGFQDVLAAAALLGGGPQNLALVGVQAEALDDWGGSLRPMIRAQIDPAISAGLDILAQWGVVPTLRPVPLADGQSLLGHGTDLGGYERNAEPWRG
jgi:hydrogenase maturation protease